MPETIIKHSLRTAGIIGAFAIVGTLLLAYVYQLTREPIAQSEARARMALFQQIVPATMHDNDLLKDTVKVPASDDLGTSEEDLAYRAMQAGKPTAVILQAIAPDGYGGEIKLLVAIRADGSIAGVRVLTHRETPGLGDYIEIERGNWIRNFDGLSLAQMSEAEWKVRKDGGSFDYMSGATITPRAVIKAVHKVLRYFDAHRAELLAPPADEGTTQEHSHE